MEDPLPVILVIKDEKKGKEKKKTAGICWKIVRDESKERRCDKKKKEKKRKSWEMKGRKCTGSTVGNWTSY